jgi:hypothetical protein
MKTNGRVALSQRLYRWLLHLYPQAYRTTYESEMFHVFTDQCREACAQRGRPAMPSLWLRTLVDVGVTVIREHLSDPQAKVGLLAPMPNAPLPWKGVLLVLIPGLIFFVSQIELVTPSKDWFFLVFFRAGYFLILPVLLIWLLTRRFPVWGLIPLGLLYGTLWSYGQRFQLSRLPFVGHLFANDTLILFGIKMSTHSLKYSLATSVCVILLGILIWHSARRGQISRSAWKWLGLYGLLIVLWIAGDSSTTRELHSFMVWQNQYLSPADLKEHLFQMPLRYLYDSLPFLLLIFIGILFARKHGGHTFLILLGYLLPTIIFGRYSIWNDPLPFYLISLAILVYRFLVAMVAPVWLVRAASLPGLQRAAAIPVAVAIISRIFLNIIVTLAVAARHIFYQPNLLDLALTIWSQLIIAAGLGLAVILYLPRQAEQTVVSPPALVATAE